MNDNKKCDHKWRSTGLWDGVDSEGKPTGGQLYKCDLCGENAQSPKEIEEKGGTLVTGTDIYGKQVETD